MLRTLSILLVSVVFSCAAQAQDVRYVSDKQYIPLRSGAGGDYRITHRGIPSGTRLTTGQVSEDGLWTEITTDRGTTGWIRSQYLMKELPAQNKLNTSTARADQLAQQNTSLASEAKTLKTERVELLKQIATNDSRLDSVSQDLAQLKKVSGNAVQLDVDNRRLVEGVENLRSEVEMLKSETNDCRTISRATTFSMARWRS